MLEVLDISRAEVKRMVSRYTLGNYSCPDDVLNEDYILVCYSIPSDYFYDRTTYRIFYPARPTICNGGNLEFCQKKGYLDFNSENIHFYSDGSSRIFCYEIWHLLDDDDFDKYYDEFERMLYGEPNDVTAIELYERATIVLETLIDSPVTVTALEIVSAFERAYDITHDLSSFYPVTTYKRKSDYALDLEELRLAGCVEDA